MTHDTTLSDSSFLNTPGSVPPEVLGLVIVWSANAGECGRVVLIPPVPVGRPYVLGRGEPNAADPHSRLLPQEDRPGGECRATPLESPRISRAQLLLEQRPNGELVARNIGKARMLHNDEASQSATLVLGDTLQLGSQLLLLCVRRAAWLRPMPPDFVFPRFGRPDANGIAGESAAIWSLRQQLEFAASQLEHVLVSGESGTGKELLARALHARSSRAGRALVSRNASTFPETLIDVELFGNAKNYPNPGTPERPGLFGQALDSSLFLDEIAELPQALQTHLLRVLDRGEYQRLGEAQSRHANVRLIGATNRPALLRSDLAARFKIGIHSPGFDERREDIPFLVHVSLRSMASARASSALRFFPNEDLEDEPRVSLALMLMLVRRRYVTHFRELEAVLWKSINQSPGDTLEPPKDELAVAAPADASESEGDAVVDPASLSPELVHSALQRNNWVVEQTWRELGLSSRHVLARLMARHGLRRS
jgi:transcriptional regulator with GAF, ATPase, and Fis domain